MFLLCGLNWHEFVFKITAITWFVFCLLSFVTCRPACVWRNHDLQASQSERPADSGAVYRYSTETLLPRSASNNRLDINCHVIWKCPIKTQDFKIWLSLACSELNKLGNEDNYLLECCALSGRHVLTCHITVSRYSHNYQRDEVKFISD
jgi:hypothetical protein